MHTFKVLNKQVFSIGPYSIIPIRFEDRYDIMKWRNEQIYHLRQNKPLTRSDQDRYFEEVVSKLFDQDQPTQILFSFLDGNICIGYGGLVHINWVDRNAEISFIIDTSLEKGNFEFYWECFLTLLKKLAFRELGLHKIYTYAFDIRPRLYVALEHVGFKEEARLKQHCRVDAEYRDVLIHSFFNPLYCVELRPASADDMVQLFDWANDPTVRKQAINTEPIPWEVHIDWFNKRLTSPNSEIYLACSFQNPVGQIRIDRQDSSWTIDYSVGIQYRGMGLGQKILSQLLARHPKRRYKAQVGKDNIASQRVFEQLSFKKAEVKVGELEMIEYTFDYG